MYNEDGKSPLYTPLNSTMKSCGWVHCASCKKSFSAKTNKIGSIWKHTETYTHFKAVQKDRKGPTSNDAHEDWLISAGLKRRAVVEKEARVNKRAKLQNSTESGDVSLASGSIPHGSTVGSDTATVPNSANSNASNTQVPSEPHFGPVPRGVQLPAIFGAFGVSGLSAVSQNRA